MATEKVTHVGARFLFTLQHCNTFTCTKTDFLERTFHLIWLFSDLQWKLATLSLLPDNLLGANTESKKKNPQARTTHTHMYRTKKKKRKQQRTPPEKVWMVGNDSHVGTNNPRGADQTFSAQKLETKAIGILDWSHRSATRKHRNVATCVVCVNKANIFISPSMIAVLFYILSCHPQTGVSLKPFIEKQKCFVSTFWKLFLICTTAYSLYLLPIQKDSLGFLACSSLFRRQTTTGHLAWCTT